MSLPTRNDGPTEAQAEEIARQMQQLRLRYIEKLKDNLALIETTIAALKGGDATLETRETFRVCAHRMAGTGTTYGYADISLRGRAVDDLLKARPDAPASVLLPLTEALRQACAQAIGADAGPVAEPQGFGRRQTTQAPQETVAVRKPVILAADDDEQILDLFRHLFDGFSDLITAHNSDETLRLMRLYRPDLVLLDDIMPASISGLRLLELLRSTGEFTTTPIVMVTASNAEADISRGLAAGARDYITKPFDPAAVDRKVRAILAAA